jgi:hypothetical protein
MLAWTGADEAEWELLVDELVVGYLDHLGQCQHERCGHLGPAVDAVIAWHRRRRLGSLAVYLRARQDLDDLKAVA